MQEYSNNSYQATVASNFIRSVYTYMFIALAISGAIAYAIGSNPDTFKRLFVTSTGEISFMFWGLVFLPLILSFVIQWGFQRLSQQVLLLLFVLYSAAMGCTLSSIFLVYEMGAIAFTFFVASGAFAGMAVLGYTTKTDLTKFGSLLYMVLIGMILAGILNMFLGSGMLDFIISVVGVFVFTGLIAYQMQQLKNVANSPEFSDETRGKLALIGGLTLYILFINLFLTLLRLLGGRD
jgi:FtsH-binding integral membrane protein